jgi:hypothetical protein
MPARRASLASSVQEHDERDELTEASNAVVDMVQAGNLDAAEQAAHDPDNYDPAFEGVFQRLIDRLEPAESMGALPPKTPGIFNAQ